MEKLYRVPCVLVGSLSLSTSLYYPVVNGLLVANVGNAAYANNALTQKIEGYYAGIRVAVSGSDSTGNTVFTLYKNGISTNLTITVPPTTLGVFENTEEYIKVEDGDTVAIKMDSLGTGAISVAQLGCDFLSQTATWKMLAGSGTILGTANRLIRPAGSGSISVNDTSSANAVRCVLPCDTVFKNMQVALNSNGKSSSSSYSIRIGTTPSALLVTIPAASTGIFSNFTDTAVASQGEMFSHLYQGSGTGNHGLRYIAVDVQSQVDGDCPIVLAAFPQTITSTISGYGPAGLARHDGALAYTYRKVQLKTGAIAKNAYTLTASNLATTDVFEEFKIENIATPLVVTIPTGALGIHSNTVDTVAIVKDSNLSWDVSRVLPSSGAYQLGSRSFVLSLNPVYYPNGVKVWNGTQWEVHPLKTWDGVQWVENPIKYWDGVQFKRL